ncbi:hypothetical protein C7Y66_28530, partial [Chroococcidiopsis sp. CCALA 051]
SIAPLKKGGWGDLSAVVKKLLVNRYTIKTNLQLGSFQHISICKIEDLGDPPTPLKRGLRLEIESYILETPNPPKSLL